MSFLKNSYGDEEQFINALRKGSDKYTRGAETRRLALVFILELDLIHPMGQAHDLYDMHYVMGLSQKDHWSSTRIVGQPEYERVSEKEVRRYCLRYELAMNGTERPKLPNGIWPRIGSKRLCYRVEKVSSLNKRRGE
ncbi:hypothetical protein LXL04_006306 [Taraxacum kok-saghyz]